jgi:DNA-binding PadR family transcriptional regulator
MTSGQTSYDLRRLRAHGFIERIEATRRYRVTPDGLAHALFLTHLAKRFLIPGMSQISDPQPLPGSRLRTASRAYQAAIDDLAHRTHLAA